MEMGFITTLNFRPTIAVCAFTRRNKTYPTKSTSFSGVSVARIPPSISNPAPIFVLRCSRQANFCKGSDDGDRILTFWKGLLNFAAANFLPLALIGGVSLGLACPSLGCRASRYSILKFSTFGIFFISGLSLQDGEVEEINKAWPAVIYGLASVLLVSPFFSRLILKVQLIPQEFVTGLAIFSCMPTTLTSGVALTQIVGGNTALALALTVMSNLLGILVVPLWISKFVAGGFGVCIPTSQIFQRLFVMILVPLVLGKVCRNSFDGLARYADQNRRALSMTSVVLLSLVYLVLINIFARAHFHYGQRFTVLWLLEFGLKQIGSFNFIHFLSASTSSATTSSSLGIGTPWIQVSKSRSLFLAVEPKVFVAAVIMGIILHLGLLCFNAFSIKCISVGFGGHNSVFAKKGNARALILVCSQCTELYPYNYYRGLFSLRHLLETLHIKGMLALQKVLLIAATVVEQLDGALGQSGLLVLPCVAAHINQIIVDSFLVSFWRQQDETQSK